MALKDIGSQCSSAPCRLFIVCDLLPSQTGVCVCVCVCVCARARARVRMCVRVYVCARHRACVQISREPQPTLTKQVL